MEIIFGKSVKEGEHFHRICELEHEILLICKNKKCRHHACIAYGCPSRMHYSYYKNDICGNKRYIKYCKNICSCHLIKCSVYNINYNRNSSSDIYVEPLLLLYDFDD